MEPGIPAVSVAMATYNGERYLQEQLESLRRQTRPPAELVVCDDGSTDATVTILERFRADAPFPVVVLRNERNVGYVETFFRAAARCGGSWVAFCDQDDVWLDHKLARLSEAILAHPDAYLVTHSAPQVDADLAPLPKRFPDHRRRSVSGPLRSRPLFVYPGFSCCVRRSVLLPALIADRPHTDPAASVRQTHDEFVYNVANTYGALVRLPDSLALYRRHGGAVTAPDGSPVYTAGLNTLRKGLAATEEGYLYMADLAMRHRDFYRHVLARGDGPAGLSAARTRNAVDYYDRLAGAFAARAALFAEGAPLARRLCVLLGSVVRREYVGFAPGRGFGAKALLKDIFRVLVRW